VTISTGTFTASDPSEPPPPPPPAAESQDQGSDQSQADDQEDDQQSEDDEAQAEVNADASLGLINSGPVQVNIQVDDPVTSGSDGAVGDGPGGMI
jgi:hypothetical protein